MNDLYRRIVGAVPEGIWVVGAEGRTIFCNQPMADILGTTLESMAGLSCFDSVFPADLAEAQRQFARNLAGDGQPFDFRLRRTDGSAIWVSISCKTMCDDAGGAAGLLGLFTDITWRKRAEAGLRESEERFRNMADTTPVMIWVSGPDMLCTFFSKQWLTFTGRSMDQEKGNGWAEGVHPDDRDRCFATYSSSFAARSNFQMEYRMRRADGEYRWVLNNGVPRFEPCGGFAGYIGSCIDITDLKHAQEQALARQKLESLGVLAGGIAHDFNNLLAGILSSAEVALAELAEGAAVEEELESIRTTAIRGAEIVSQLMMHTGKDSPVCDPLDLGVLVQEMLQLIKASISKHATLKTELRKDLPVVQANAAQLRQVVMNLVINASEAIGGGEGEIRIATTLVNVRQAASLAGVTNLPEGDYVQLDVSDTGGGMTPEIQARIFDPFFTTKHAGRGLGLAAVQGIIHSHGGAIKVASARGQGSRFSVLLPCSIQPEPATRDSATPDAASAGGGVAATILIIEDEDSLRVAVAKMLRKEGHFVVEAGDGASGINLFRANASEIDLVLLDMTLPGKPVLEILEELRRIRADVRVILTTAYSEYSAAAAVGAQRPWLYLRKPFQFSELVALIRTSAQQE